MMKRFFIIAAAIGLLASCGDPADNHPNNGTNKSTLIVFDNTQGICAVSVYDDYRRRDEDKIAEVPAGQKTGEIEYTPASPYLFTFYTI